MIDGELDEERHRSRRSRRGEGDREGAHSGYRDGDEPSPREGDQQLHRERAERSRGEGELASRRDGERARSRAPKAPLGEVDEIAPGRVTALHERRAGSSRYVVEIGNRVVATVSVEVIADLGLRVGGEVDVLTADRLREAASQLAVFDKAVALLAVRPRTARDLQLRLRRAGASAPTIARAIERLERLGFVDDEAYARTVARSRALSGGRSRRRIAQELQRHGVDRATVDAAVAETIADVGLDEGEAALGIARRRMLAMGGLDPRKQRQRLYAFLARRGYDPDIVARVVARVLDEARADD